MHVVTQGVRRIWRRVSHESSRLCKDDSCEISFSTVVGRVRVSRAADDGIAGDVPGRARAERIFRTWPAVAHH